ncbi:MAG: amidophosphoribosyltransferase [Saprospirales bacterium]|nr:MAG: amidophosphoribosyltransferase [Saprospirales bacterium]
MSDQIKHECGLAFLRLLKPISFYKEKYGTALYGLNKMQLLLQKQRNRGQDGAGLATIKLDLPPGSRYISRRRSNSPNYLKDLFTGIFSHFSDLSPEYFDSADWLKLNKPYVGELYLGHLRYGTHGDNSIETVHPFLRQNNWMTRNLVLAGNFNLTNVDELFSELVELGQFPKEKSDTVTVLEKLGHFLDDEVERLYTWFKPDGHTNQEINELIFKHLDVARMLRRACKKFDGGFVMGGMIGHGDAFVLRDPNGIRPAYYYRDDEVVVVASERPAIQTAMNVRYREVQEIKPGHALIVKKDGRVSEEPYTDIGEKKSCSFERIYFSRGTDRDIYLERKKLGEQLTERALQAIDYDIENTVWSAVPNTAETAFYGLIDGLEKYLNKEKAKRILELGEKPGENKLKKILNMRPRVEKIIVKDAKMRTFIADEVVRGDMVSHVYDVTYGIVQNEVDKLVLLDDSIVRGTTLRDSIIRIANRLKPSMMVILSSAPQIRYPDCYGIDMSQMGKFVAFRAMVDLLEESGRDYLLEEAYQKCVQQLNLPKSEVSNELIPLYDQFTEEEISDRIAKLLTPPDVEIPVKVIYQSVKGLHRACPDNKGDWYFTGNYPTPGGNAVANRAFMNYMEKKDVRAY